MTKELENIQPEKEPELEIKEELSESEKKKKYKVEIISDINEGTIREVCEIEKESFPEEMQSSPEDLREVLENKDGIHLLVKDEKEKVLGAILSLRQSQEYDYLKDYDPDFIKDKEALYIESIAIKPESRNISSFQ